MLVESILMELRSRLRSCNVFITTGIDFTKNVNLKISIQANCIVLSYYNDDKNDFKSLRRDSLSSIESLSDCCSEDEFDFCSTIQIAKFCNVIPNSMSCLKIDKNTISFRVLTEPKNGGNFYNEIISANDFQKSIEAVKLKINVSIGAGAKLTCSNCSNIISDGSITFGRILELPTANLDMSEWFCHGHGHNSNTKNDLQSNKTDFLYRLTYFVVNQSVLSDKANKFNSKRNIYYCNRCLAWLGLKNKDTVKLFNSEVKMYENDIEKRVFTQKNDFGTVPLNDLIYTIENMTREFNLGFQYTVMCKIILECKISATNQHFLLIWVMDKELQVLRNVENHIVPDKIELQSTLVTKILYKVHLSLNEEVESWMSDPGVVSTDVSKNMFTEGVNHLENMSLKVPESFRYTNGYHVSYLKI